MIPEIKEADKIIDEMNGATYEKAEMLRTKLEKCTSSFSDMRVDGSSKIHNRDLKIYFDKKYFHLTNAQLELKWGLSKRHINRVCKKIEKNK